MQSNSTNVAFLSEKEAAKALGISRTFLMVERGQGKITYYKFGRRVLYDENDLKVYAERNRKGA